MSLEQELEDVEGEIVTLRIAIQNLTKMLRIFAPIEEAEKAKKKGKP